jgi:hypothetical protein
MIPNLNDEHARFYEIVPLPEDLFRYIGSLSLPETPYLAGRATVLKNHCSGWNSHDSIDFIGIYRMCCVVSLCITSFYPSFATPSFCEKYVYKTTKAPSRMKRAFCVFLY